MMCLLDVSGPSQHPVESSLSLFHLMTWMMPQTASTGCSPKKVCFPVCGHRNYCRSVYMLINEKANHPRRGMVHPQNNK